MLMDKVAIVTGGANGIGKEVAMTLAQHFAKVVIVDINQKAAINTMAEIKEAGSEAMEISGDLTNEAFIQEVVQQTISAYGRIDILVNCAGIICTGDLFSISGDKWDKVMTVNVKTLFLLTKAVLAHMVVRKQGKVINIASVAGKRGGGLLGNSCYAASKGAVIAFTKSVAREVGRYHINVNAVAPALTETNMTSMLTGKDREKVIQMMPLGRAGKPKDIANAVLFLASEYSDFITGEIMDVDGGLMMD